MCCCWCCWLWLLLVVTLYCRLLREDCLQPLREGIQAYRESLNTRDVRVYTQVKIVGIMCSRNGLVYRVSFETDRPVTWAKSKRLIYGSLLCLSPDKFDTLLWATVSQRDDALLAGKQQIGIITAIHNYIFQHLINLFLRLYRKRCTQCGC